MTGRPPAPRLTPECHLGECGLCPGPQEIRLPWQSAAETPVHTIRCTHPCHQTPPRPAERPAPAALAWSRLTRREGHDV